MEVKIAKQSGDCVRQNAIIGSVIAVSIQTIKNTRSAHCICTLRVGMTKDETPANCSCVVLGVKQEVDVPACFGSVNILLRVGGSTCCSCIEFLAFGWRMSGMLSQGT